jgi:Flp pilus assembly protein TadD
VLAAYLPALHGGLLWDDGAHVTRLQLRSLHGLWRIWFDVGATQQYYPVLHSAFWVEHRLWGDAVLGYHLANVALHAAACWLLLLVLRALELPAPFLASLLFALHPVCVESVAWISEQKNTLSAVFYLGALLGYLRFDGARTRAAYAAASVLFALALLTKTVTATLPAAILVLLWWRRGSLGLRRDVVPLLPWFAAAAVAGLFTASVETRLIGAEGADFSMSAPQRLLIAARALVFYAGKDAWPSGLSFVYPRWRVDAGDPAQYLYLAAVVAALAALVLLARRSRGPVAAFLLFAGTLFPVLGFLNVYPFVYSFVADHFQYLAVPALIVPAAWAMSLMAQRLPLAPAGRVLALLVLPAWLGVLSWRQSANYRDSDTLNRATLERNPAAWRAHYDLAVSLGRSPGGIEPAISQYRETLRLKPDYWAAHNNLGAAYLRTGDGASEAVEEFEAALRLNPGNAEVQGNLAVALGRIPGRLAEAVTHAREAVRIRPDDAGAHATLGDLLLRQPGKGNEASEEFTQAVRLAPANARYHYDLANALAADPARLTDAVAHYRAALRLSPGMVEAHANLGAALGRIPGQEQASIGEYEEAVKLAPGNGHLHANLGNALAKVPSRSGDAVAQFRRALAIDPADAQAHAGLGVALLDLPGSVPEAVSEFRSAVRLDPGSGLAHYGLAVAIMRSGGSAGEARDNLVAAMRLQPGLEPLARRALEKLDVAGRRAGP